MVPALLFCSMQNPICSQANMFIVGQPKVFRQGPDWRKMTFMFVEGLHVWPCPLFVKHLLQVLGEVTRGKFTLSVGFAICKWLIPCHFILSRQVYLCERLVHFACS